MTDAEAGITHGEAAVNGVRLHYAQAGQGPLVLLLHGFPEFWYAWRHLLPALADAGFHAVAPDLRGYNLSDKPRAVSDYRVEHTGADVAALAAHLSDRPAAVVGHDWGGIVAWYAAAWHPERFRCLAAINAPHPRAMNRELKTADQRLRSWYAAFFQLPWLPEAVLRAGNFKLLERALRREPVRRDAYTDEDVRCYKEAWSQPGALTAMLSWYRALRPSGMPRIPDIHLPTLLVWGERDPHLRPQLTEGLDAWVPGIRVERLPDASHWVPAEFPERVARLLADFIRSH
ncbi:MAG TPA: alpha/beta fold hydrolase [Longimicrobiaceae bacterium]|jgi:pimeloyl-ACP methyl ester carboxylesterase|nr:alpha/beta fold hydrolase [Longimicrobiaceae bacterium]